MHSPSQQTLIDALRVAEAALTATLAKRGYNHGECTDDWSPCVRGEIEALATIRAVLGPSLAEFLAAYPVPPRSMEPVARNWDFMLPDERAKAIARIPVYMAVLAESGRKHIPSPHWYLLNQSWKYIAVVSAIEHSPEHASAPPATPPEARA